MAAAQDVTTRTAGGTGGDAYTVSCGAKAMVGISGRWSSHVLGIQVDELRPLCVSINTDGSWIGSPTLTSTDAGKTYTGAESLTLTCRPGQAVNGIQGMSGIYLDILQIYCAGIGEYGHLSDAGTWQQPTIGEYTQIVPTSFGPFLCPNGKPAKGITGKAHDWIDAVALVCNYPSVPPASVASVSVTPRTIVGGETGNGSFSLNAHAPSGGTTVGFSVQLLASDVSKVPANPIAVNPTLVPAGQIGGSFVVHTLPVAATVPVTINVATPTAFFTATFSIIPPSLSSLSLTPGRVAPGSSVLGSVGLNGNAAAGGVSVGLTSSVPAAATVPPTVVVPQAQSSITFPVTPVSTKAACTVVTASGVFTPTGGSSQKQATLAISQAVNKAFTFNAPPSGAGSVTGTLTLPAPTKDPRLVSLVSSNQAILGVPSSVTIGTGASTANVSITIQGSPPSGIQCAVVTATDRDGNANALIFEVVGTSLRRIG